MWGAPPERYPRTAYLLVVIGGLLIALLAALSGLVVWAFQSEVSEIAGVSVSLSPLEIFELVTAAALGLVIVYGGYSFRARPASARTWGLGVIVLAIATVLLDGGGDYLGAILVIIGGVIAYRWKAPLAVPGPTGGWGGSNPPPPPPPTGPSKFCTTCGAPNLAPARFCARCGAAFPA